MSCEITSAVLDGGRVTITPDCWPLRGKVKSVRVSMTKQTSNGVVTLNRNVVAADKSLEQLGEAIADAIRKIAETAEMR